MKTRRKYLVIAGSALVHGVILILLFTSRGAAPPGSAAEGISVSVVDGRALAETSGETPRPQPPAAQAAATPPTQAERDPMPPSDIVPQFMDVDLPQPEIIERSAMDDPIALSMAASAAAGTPCDLPQWLQKALENDPQVVDALAHIPRRARSVANAIMLWDGAWVGSGANAEPGVKAIRQAVMAGVLAAPQVCRDQPIRGPEILILADGMGNTVLVIGSGSWRWEDLLVGSLPSAASRLVAITVSQAKP